MTIDPDVIAARLWAVRPPRRRRLVANILVHSLERLATGLATSQRPESPPKRPREGDEGHHDEAADADDDMPSQAELEALEAELEGGDDDESSDLDAFTAANAALETKLTFEGCETIAAAVIELHTRFAEARVSTDPVLHLIETLEDPEVGEATVNFDRLHDPRSSV